MTAKYVLRDQELVQPSHRPVSERVNVGPVDGLLRGSTTPARRPPEDVIKGLAHGDRVLAKVLPLIGVVPPGAVTERAGGTVVGVIEREGPGCHPLPVGTGEEGAVRDEFVYLIGISESCPQPQGLAIVALVRMYYHNHKVSNWGKRPFGDRFMLMS